MNLYAPYNKSARKYLYEMKDLFGSWNKKKGPKQFYFSASNAKGALSNVMHGVFWDPDDWEIHEMSTTVERRIEI